MSMWTADQSRATFCLKLLLCIRWRRNRWECWGIRLWDSNIFNWRGGSLNDSYLFNWGNWGGFWQEGFHFDAWIGWISRCIHSEEFRALRILNCWIRFFFYVEKFDIEQLDMHCWQGDSHRRRNTLSFNRRHLIQSHCVLDGERVDPQSFGCWIQC